MADELIKNTIAFRFPDGAPSPSLVEMARFIKGLDADKSSMETSYKVAEERSIFIKFRTNEAMKDALAQNAETILFSYSNEKTVQVTMAVAGSLIRYVRIFDLPPEVTDANIAAVLGKFGCIKRMVKEKFPAELELDLYTGVRGVYVEIKKEIPTSLFFSNRRGRIYYEGIKQKCFLCKKEGHLKANCPQNKNGNSGGNSHQLDGTRSALPVSSASRVETQAVRSYSGVVQNLVPVRTPPELQLKMTTLTSSRQAIDRQTDVGDEESRFTKTLCEFAEQESMECEEAKTQSAVKRNRSPLSETATDEDGFTQQASRRTRRVKKDTLARIATTPKEKSTLVSRSQSK